MRALLIVVYVLHLFWTGLWASIAAQALKLNALWFCLLLGTVCLIGGVMYRLEKTWLARLLVGPAAALVTGFYVYSFVNDPGVDATFRVGLIILSSIGVQLVLFFPPVGVENEDVSCRVG